MPYVVLAYKGADNLQGKHLKAALPMQEENTEAWIEKEYPDWDVKFYDSWEGCVKALKKDRSTSYRSILPHGDVVRIPG